MRKNSYTKTTMFFFCSALLISSSYAAGTCLDYPAAFESMNDSITWIKKQNPQQLDVMEPDKCKPKISGVMAFGSPLCSFADEVPAMSVIAAAFTDPSEVLSYGYMFEHSHQGHQKIFDYLNSRYKIIPPSNYPNEYKNLPVQHELTALFDAEKVWILLQKDSDGMPKPWISQVNFVNKKHVATLSRDPNSCKIKKLRGK